MRRSVTLLMFTALAVLAASPAARAQSLLFDYVGFDYEAPNPDPTQFGEPGSGYVGLGTVGSLFAPLVANTTLNEYTYVMQGLTPVSVQVVSNYRIFDYGPGTITIYEDPKSGGTAADSDGTRRAAASPAAMAASRAAKRSLPRATRLRVATESARARTAVAAAVTRITPACLPCGTPRCPRATR